MSRWLCYLLVLANGLVFWLASQSYVPQETRLAQANLPRVAALQLVGETTPPEVPETTGDLPVTDCFLVSGFTSQEDARRWREQQELESPQARTETITVRLPPHYWVLEPPLNNREAALSRLANIQQKGIDSFLIATGEQQWGISLGLFETRERAETLLSRLNDEGLEATLRQRERNEQLYGLVGGERLQQKAKSQLLQPNGLALALQPCEGVAKAGKSP
ncbi:MAG: SPOR domain-containing protein [Halomonadaceae bacterium]|nr:MAG: SPOR domain-containing protein [Halomonadaceae bacterium]